MWVGQPPRGGTERPSARGLEAPHSRAEGGGQGRAEPPGPLVGRTASTERRRQPERALAAARRGPRSRPGAPFLREPPGANPHSRPEAAPQSAPDRREGQPSAQPAPGTPEGPGARGASAYWRSVRAERPGRTGGRRGEPGGLGLGAGRAPRRQPAASAGALASPSGRPAAAGGTRARALLSAPLPAIVPACHRSGRQREAVNPPSGLESPFTPVTVIPWNRSYTP